MSLRSPRTEVENVESLQCDLELNWAWTATIMLLPARHVVLVQTLQVVSSSRDTAARNQIVLPRLPSYLDQYLIHPIDSSWLRQHKGKTM